MNTGNLLILEAVGTIFWAPLDEELFFLALQKIKSVHRYYGELRTLYIEIDLDKVDPDDIRDIIGVFYRYKVDLKQLASLVRKLEADPDERVDQFLRTLIL